MFSTGMAISTTLCPAPAASGVSALRLASQQNIWASLGLARTLGHNGTPCYCATWLHPGFTLCRPPRRPRPGAMYKMHTFPHSSILAVGAFVGASTCGCADPEAEGVAQFGASGYVRLCAYAGAPAASHPLGRLLAHQCASSLERGVKATSRGSATRHAAYCCRTADSCSRPGDCWLRCKPRACPRRAPTAILPPWIPSCTWRPTAFSGVGGGHALLPPRERRLMVAAPPTVSLDAEALAPGSVGARTRRPCVPRHASHPPYYQTHVRYARML